MPLFEVLVSVGTEPAAVVVLVSVGTEPAAVVELALPLSPVDPVATAASADTTAVVVLLGCGLFAAGWHENMTDLALYRSVPAANWKQLSDAMAVETSAGTPHAESW